jgi:hypothetical protein
VNKTEKGAHAKECAWPNPIGVAFAARATRMWERPVAEALLQLDIVIDPRARIGDSMVTGGESAVDVAGKAGQTFVRAGPVQNAEVNVVVRSSLPYHPRDRRRLA